MILDGTLIASPQKTLESFSPGKLRGRGVFETMLAQEGKIYALDEHLQRLDRGLKVLNLTRPCAVKKLKEYLRATLSANRLKTARLRLTVWRDQGRDRICTIALPHRPIPEFRYRRGMKAGLAVFERKLFPKEKRIKSIEYLPYLRAYQKAVRRGYEEMVLLNRDGFLMEGSRSNLFFISYGILYTPALACGCLKGITRQTVIGLARRMGLKVLSVKAKPQKLWEAQEAFLTNSVMGIMPLVNVGEHPIGKRKAGPLTRKLFRAYGQLIRQKLE